MSELTFNNLVSLYRSFGEQCEFDTIGDISIVDTGSSALGTALYSLIQSSKADSHSNNCLIQEVAVNGSTILHFEELNEAKLISEIESKPVSIEMSTRGISQGSFFYSMEAFLSHERLSQEPELYFISTLDYCSNESTELPREIANYRNVLAAINLLTGLAHHTQVNDGPGTTSLFFYLESEIFEVPIAYSQLPIALEKDKLAALNRDLGIGDYESPHSQEKQRIFRKALASSLEITQQKANRFQDFLENFSKISETYERDMDLYLNEFSFKKLLNEVAEKKLEFIGKINGLMTDMQLKLMSIPVALILLAQNFKSGAANPNFDIPISAAATFFCLFIIGMCLLQLDILRQAKRDANATFEFRRVKETYKSEKESVESILTKAKKAVSWRANCYMFCIFLLTVSVSWAFKFPAQILIDSIFLKIEQTQSPASP